MYSKVGSFTAPASTGTQSTTGIGFQPKAIVFWYAASTASGWSNDNQNGIGFVTASGSGAVSGASINGNTTQRYNHSATAIYATNSAGTVTLSASLTSLDSSGFTLNWVTTTSGDEIHYLALGGTDITGAMVKQWQAQGNTTNPQAVTGVGFKPDLVFHISSHNTTTPPATTTGNKRLDIGAMDSNGNQWAQSRDGDSGPSWVQVGRYQLTNACIVTQTANNAKATQAAYTSMDNDGFTVTWSADTTTPYIYSLCLKGGSYQVGHWSKSTSAATDTITTTNVVLPTAVLVTSNDVATTSANTLHDRHMLGASDGTNNHVAVMTEENGATVSYKYWDTANSLYVVNNDTKTMQTAGTLGGFTTNAFTASYSTHDSVATEFCFVAFGGIPLYVVTPAIDVSESQSIAPTPTVTKVIIPNINVSESISQASKAAVSITQVVNASESKAITQAKSGAAPWVATNVSECKSITPTIDADITGYAATPTINNAESCNIDPALQIVLSSQVINTSESSSTDPLHVAVPKVNLSESISVSPTLVALTGVAPDIIVSESVNVDPYAAGVIYVYPEIAVAEGLGIDPAEGNISSVTAYATPVINTAESLALTQVSAQPWVFPATNVSESLTTIPTVPPPESGTGKLWFGGVDITTAPYYAHLAYETKYWFLDGLDSMQFVTNPLSLVSTRPYLKDWLISTVLRVIAPDKTRSTLLASLIALSELFDPLNGEQKLIFYEYPGSYFMAKRQTSTLANETASPYVAEIDIEWACTGPAYSNATHTVQRTILGMTTHFTVTSNGDSQASPVWRIYVGLSGKNRFRFTNTTTGESVVWGLANVAFGDVIEFIMDPEYGTPYTVLKNGVPSLSTVSGPAWPHLVPGPNLIEVRQSYPAPEIVEVEWRDRFMVGQQVFPTYPIQPAAELPTEVSLTGVDASTPVTNTSTTFLGTPTICAPSSDTLDVFVTGNDHVLYLTENISGTWNNTWQKVGGTIGNKSGPGATSEGGVDDIVTGGANEDVYYVSGTRGAWGSWKSIGGSAASAVSICTNSSDNLFAFITGNDKAVWEVSRSSGAWGSWNSLGGNPQLNTAPACCSWDVGRLDVFVAGQDGALWHTWYSGSWGTWESLGGNITASPGAASLGSGQIGVFARGKDGALWMLEYYSGAWSTWTKLGGALRSGTGPGVCVSGGKYHIVVQGTDENLYYLTGTRGSWASWVNVTNNSTSTQGKDGSYIFSGRVEDVFFNGVPDATVNLYVSTPVGSVDIAWGLAAPPAITDVDGNFTFDPTTPVNAMKHFRAYFGGDKTHISAYSPTIAATPPSLRTATTCDLKQTGTDPNYEFYGALNSTTGYVANVPMILQISIAAGGTDHYEPYWRNAPANFTTDKVVATTDINGNFGFFYTPGSGIEYFRAYHPGDLNYLESYSSPPPTASLTVTEGAQWPTQEPGPIDYWVCLNKNMVDAGRAQYFAALGFTTCVLTANYDDTTSVYADELAMITALGMTPVIDVEFTAMGGEWNYGDFSVYTEWLKALVAAGWTTAASEAGWPGCIEFVYSCGFTGYVNYGIALGPLTFTWPYPSSTNPTTVEGMYINQGTTANSWEYYFDKQVGVPGQNEVKGGIAGAALLGIPNGVIMGVGVSNSSGGTAYPLTGPNEIYLNSMLNTTPTSLGTGNTYESIFAWSYDNGVGLDFLNIFFYPLNAKVSMNTFFNGDYLPMVERLQVDYPAANTDQLIPPTVLATYATVDRMINADGTNTFSGTLTELVSGNAIVGESVHFQVASVENGPYTDLTITSDEGANPAITDSDGGYMWENVPLTIGTIYYFRVYYAGDATHMPTYGPYDGPVGFGMKGGQ